MRKLLILMLVLGMASLANATMQISVMGDEDPCDSEIWMMPSDEIELDVHVEMADALEYGYWLMIVDVADGYITEASGSPTGLGNLTSENSYYVPGYGYYYLDNATGFCGLSPANYGGGNTGYVGNSTDIPLSGTAIDGIIFHCEGPDDAVIELWTSSSGAAGEWSLEDTATIHQIPEPITMALLGLGGLLLRRRK